MKIDPTTDTLFFDASDIAMFSDIAQKSLALFVGERLPPEQYLSDIINAEIAKAKESFRIEKVQSLKDLGDAIVFASDDVKAKVQPLIDQAAVLLGLQPKILPSPIPNDDQPTNV